MLQFIKPLLGLIVFMHCLGVTQLCSAFVKNNSVFISMIDMSEEETKTEKECKDECDSDKNIHPTLHLATAELAYTLSHTYYGIPQNRIGYQFVIESPTPPPDYKGR